MSVHSSPYIHVVYLMLQLEEISLIINLEGSKRIRMFVSLLVKKKTVDILYITFYPQNFLDTSLRNGQIVSLLHLYWYTGVHRRSNHLKYILTLK